MGKITACFCTTLAFLVAELGLVVGDITDGNAEHLKREHSLMKPYQGKKASSAANARTLFSLLFFSCSNEAITTCYSFNLPESFMLLYLAVCVGLPCYH